MTQLLVTIRPVWVDAIFENKKDIELRKTPPLKQVSHLVIYKKNWGIIGRAEISEVLVKSVPEIFRLTNEGERAYVNKVYFWDYYQGKTNATAIIIENPQKLAIPIPKEEVAKILGRFTPPQNFIYLEDSDWDKLVFQSQLIGAR